MPDIATIERLRGLILSAADLQSVGIFPDWFIEDYLNILDNFVTIAELLDVNNLTKEIIRITSADSPYTVLSADHVIFCDTDSGDIEINLLAGTKGREFQVSNVGSSGNIVEVDLSLVKIKS